MWQQLPTVSRPSGSDGSVTTTSRLSSRDPTRRSSPAPGDCHLERRASPRPGGERWPRHRWIDSATQTRRRRVLRCRWPVRSQGRCCHRSRTGPRPDGGRRDGRRGPPRVDLTRVGIGAAAAQPVPGRPHGAPTRRHLRTHVTLKAKDASLLHRRHPCVTRRRRRQESAAPGRVLSDLGVWSLRVVGWSS